MGWTELDRVIPLTDWLQPRFFLPIVLIVLWRVIVDQWDLPDEHEGSDGIVDENMLSDPKKLLCEEEDMTVPEADRLQPLVLVGVPLVNFLLDFRADPE